MKNRILILSLLVMTSLYGCSGDKPTNSSNTTSAVITTINPPTGKIGDVIVITGSNFSAVKNTSFVSFNNTQVTEYLNWSDTAITVKVPTGTISGKVSVTVNGQESNKVDFAVIGSIEYGTLTDIDGITYKTVKICNQWWMAENLNVSHYRNGESIPEVEDSAKWENLKTDAWCYYNKDTALGAIYGKLYNWYAVIDQRGLAPVGWHLPSESEWDSLITCLGGVAVAGGKMKDTLRWIVPNIGATNESGFSARPGGFRSEQFSFKGFTGIHSNACWWSYSSNINYVLVRWLFYGKTRIDNVPQNKNEGFSVRCVKD